MGARFFQVPAACPADRFPVPPLSRHKVAGARSLRRAFAVVWMRGDVSESVPWARSQARRPSRTAVSRLIFFQAVRATAPAPRRTTTAAGAQRGRHHPAERLHEPPRTPHPMTGSHHHRRSRASSSHPALPPRGRARGRLPDPSQESDAMRIIRRLLPAMTMTLAALSCLCAADAERLELQQRRPHRGHRQRPRRPHAA